MVVIDKLFLALLTRNKENAGTDSDLNLTIDIDGLDVVNFDYDDPSIGQGEAGLYPMGEGPFGFDPFESSPLTNSSIRLGIRGDDLWLPRDVLLLGREQTPDGTGEVLALAVELDTTVRLSTDNNLGTGTDAPANLSIPLRLVSSGSSGTIIRRVLLLLKTATGDNDGTDDSIVLKIKSASTEVLTQEIKDTTQSDLEPGYANWYGPFDVDAPFTRSGLSDGGEITLSISGQDKWLPSMVFVLGFDTAEGRPTEIVTLVSIPEWTMGYLSIDDSEDPDGGIKHLPVI
jgi:hypothetical protein